MLLKHGPVRGIRSGRIRWSLNSQSVCYRLGDTLIDTGPPSGWRTIRRFVKEEHARQPIRKIIVTHHHEDHAGNAGRLQNLLDVPVFAPSECIDRLADGFSMELYRYIVWGRPSRVQAHPLPDQISVGFGHELQKVPAPGHADDMVCLYEAKRGWLFSADLYITARPQYLRYDEDLEQLVASLRRVRELSLDTVFCGHQGIVEHGARAIKRKLHYLVSLCARACALREAGQSSEKIRDELLGNEGLLYYVSRGDFAKQRLIDACLDGSGETPGRLAWQRAA